MIIMSLFIVFSALGQTNTFTTTETQSIRPVDEGNGIGFRLNGRDATFYGTIGLSAMDISFKYVLPWTNPTDFFYKLKPYTDGKMGATGRFSFVTGGSNVAQGNQSSILGGLGNVALGSSSSAMGQMNIADGTVSFVTGQDNFNTSTGLGAFVGGTSNYNSGQTSLIHGTLNKSKNSYSTILSSSQSIIDSLYRTANDSTKYTRGFGNSIISSTLAKASGHYSTVIASPASEMNDGFVSNIIGSNTVKINFAKGSGIVSSTTSSITGSFLKYIGGTQYGNSVENALIIGSTDSKIEGANTNNGIYSSRNSSINGTKRKFPVTSWQLTSVIIGARNSRIDTASNVFVQGVMNVANNHNEIIFGQGATLSPKVGSNILGTHKIFKIGNGVKTDGTEVQDNTTEDQLIRQDALYVQRNGDVGVQGILLAKQFQQTGDAVVPVSATATGVKGEIRVTKDYIYFCWDTNKWTRTPMTAW